MTPEARIAVRRSLFAVVGFLTLAFLIWFGLRWYEALHRADGLWVRDTVMAERKDHCSLAQTGILSPGIIKISGRHIARHRNSCRVNWAYPLRNRIAGALGYESKAHFWSLGVRCENRATVFPMDMDTSGGGRLFVTGFIFDSSGGDPVSAHSSYLRCPDIGTSDAG